MGLGVNALAPFSSVYKRVMYYLKRAILRFIFRLIGMTPSKMSMVQYWKKDHGVVAAKVMKNKEGALVMKMEGEKEIFPGFPRGHLLFGTLSKLKHEIKNQIFNESWRKLEANVPISDITADVKKKLTDGLMITDGETIPVGKQGEPIMNYCFYDMVPPEKMIPAAREVWRVMSILEREEPKLRWLKLALTYILQEDDAYRFRFQWLVPVLRGFPFTSHVTSLKLALDELENAEIVGDMKDRVRLLRRVLMALLSDTKIKRLFIRFCREMDWKKVKLTKADKFHFRGKWFRVDLDCFAY